jgi:hypothetical protein
MPVAAHVPAELLLGPFRARDAVEARRLTANQLRSQAWRRLFRGVYVHRSVPDTPELRVSAARLALPGDVVAAGLLAAWLHLVWTPLPGREVPLCVTRPVPRTGERFAGVHRRRLTLRGTADWFGSDVGHSAVDRDVGEVDGMLVTSPLRTCFDLMRQRRLVEAVVVADAFVHQLGLARELLAVYAADRRRWPGVRECRVAVDLCRENVRSPGESRLRMVPVLAGLPEPWVNVPIVDSTGSVLAVPDLWLPGRRPVGLEYDGAYHDDTDQPLLDRRRTNRITRAAGLPILRYDRTSVTEERYTILDDIHSITGLKAPALLDDADFWRPPRHLAW